MATDEEKLGNLGGQLGKAYKKIKDKFKGKKSGEGSENQEDKKDLGQQFMDHLKEAKKEFEEGYKGEDEEKKNNGNPQGWGREIIIDEHNKRY